MTPTALGLILIALVVGWAIGKATRDERLKRRLDDALEARRAWEATARVHQRATDAEHAARIAAEQQARDNELAINLLAFELDRQRDALGEAPALAMVPSDGGEFEWVRG